MLPNVTEAHVVKRFVNDKLVEEKSTPTKWSNSPQRDVPTKVTFNGDFSKCQEAVKPVMKFLGKMKNAVKISNGNIKQLWSQIQTLPTGQQFICSVEHNFSKVEIFAGGEGAVKKDIYYACYCDCDFSIGYIVERTDDLDGYIPAYTVAICGGQGLYNIFENILTSDFTEYVPGQQVLVMAYHASHFDCCLATGVTSAASGCNPAISPLSTDAEDWRTTYRILPYCITNIPRWEKIKEVYADVR